MGDTKLRHIRFLVLLSVLWLAACAPSVIEIPADYTAKTLQVLPAKGQGDANQHGAAFSAARTKAVTYPDLFTVVEVANDDQTLLLDISIDTFDQSTSQDGNAKYGFTTNYRSEVTVTATLLDPATGAIVSTATRQGSDRSDDGYPGFDDALRYAINNAVDTLFRTYAASL